MLWTTLLFLLLILAVGVLQFTQKHATEQLTDAFLSAVESGDPAAVARLFCRNGILLGTVSRIERRGADIQNYFNYFARLPNIRVLSKKHEITELEPDVYVNNAFVEWTWDGLETPITARMSFFVKNDCIFELHSSALPEENEKLHKASHKY